MVRGYQGQLFGPRGLAPLGNPLGPPWPPLGAGPRYATAPENCSDPSVSNVGNVLAWCFKFVPLDPRFYALRLEILFFAVSAQFALALASTCVVDNAYVSCECTVLIILSSTLKPVH